MPTTFAPARRLLHALLLSACALPSAHALSVDSISPSGEVPNVERVLLRFKQDAVRFGDAQAAAPVQVRCQSAPAKGSGRWNNAREWLFTFNETLPPGTSCEVTPVAGFKAVDGSAITGLTRHSFNTGGPAVVLVRPSTYRAVEEDQVFVLGFNGAATAQSVSANTWCNLAGLGERVPVRLLEGKARQDVLNQLDLGKRDAEKPAHLHVLSCQRRLAPGTEMQLMVSPGVSTPNGLVSQHSRRFSFDVRAEFLAEMNCERENAQSACLPLRPIRLSFNSPVTRAQAEKIRLQAGKTEHKPKFDESGNDPEQLIQSLSFAPPFAEREQLSLNLPADFKDASGRALANASSFPLKFSTGNLPPLVKFAAAPFGVIERFAEGSDGPALMPLTVRYVEPNLSTSVLPVQHLQAQTDADIIEWFTRLQRFDQALVLRKHARAEVKGPLPPPPSEDSKDYVESRAVSLLSGREGVQSLEVPAIDKKQSPRPFEVVGLPLTPGFHVLEVGSPALGQGLLRQEYGPQRSMYVRSSALVTNLAVHFKLGRSDSLAWVTALDSGKPVPNADVRVSDCRGRLVAQARTDAQGLARFDKLNPEPHNCTRDSDDWLGSFHSAYFVSARAENKGVQDMSFTWSSWQNGIESWRFNLPTNTAATPDTQAHTVLDRSLLRAGETVSMKHFLRTQTRAGFGLPERTPEQLLIRHLGSGQEYTLPLQWRKTATGGLSAESSFAIPAAAKLGWYQIEMGDMLTERFRVEEFRLPVFKGRIGPQSKDPAVAASALPVDVQLSYIDGGPAGNLPVQVSAVARTHALFYEDYPDYSFMPPRDPDSRPSDNMDETDGEEEPAARQDQRVVADKLPLTLNAAGQGQVTLKDLPASKNPQRLLLEATYADPNGEIQTLSASTTLWPAAVVVGLRSESWISDGKSAKLQAVVLDLNGKPKASVPVDIKAQARTTYTSRKRMVGGFYTYDSRTEVKDLGTICSGVSDAHGLLRCDAKLTQPGEIELVASARDAQGKSAQAADSIWVVGQGELWFGGENHDRMDLLPEKKQYAPGETARFQVRMPFRKATALVSVEREGILETQVVELEGDDPTISVPIGANWSPNVYVSVLALRGRLIDVPWYSFFTWGFKQPITWWRAYWHDSKDYIPPTALVDLSKPAFRLGVAEIRVDSADKRLAVDVKTDRSNYPVRGTAQVNIEVKQPNGQPAAHAEVAVAAVDEALLELWPNTTWNVLDAMLQRRSWGVETATAQMEIVGRRHYGRKAVPAGGDGGSADPSRELLDTLLLWRPSVQLDAQGRATLQVPLKDALSSFRIVAVADAGTSLFGTGSATIRTTQDLQIISGLPPLVRSGDEFRAQFTLRNTTAQAMKVQVSPGASFAQLQAQTLELPAGQSQEVAWTVTAPTDAASLQAGQLSWHIQAKDSAGQASDALKLSQRLLPAVPVTVRQAHLAQLDGALQQSVAPPASALPGQGGVQLSLQASLADGLPGVRRWFEQYPYSCLEQKTSIALGLNDAQRWQSVVSQLPTYLSDAGLASYFPGQTGAQGSPALTAWMLAATHEAARHNPAFALPAEVRQLMLSGLTQFVEGKLEVRHWAPRDDLDVRKLAAIEALSRYGAARPAMLSSITPQLALWPSSSLIDWISVLHRVKGVPQQQALLDEATQALRARITWSGTRVTFATEGNDNWWWLMTGGDVNSARLLLLALEDAANWKDELPRLATGLLARQTNGAWNTTTANLWGTLAFRQFGRQTETEPVKGITRASLGEAQAQVDWSQVKRNEQGNWINHQMQLPWPPAGKGTLNVAQEGSGRPWLTMLSLAAVPLTAPTNAGYQITRTVTPVEQADKSLPAGQYSRGDVLRVSLNVKASADMTWVAISDPVPTGATILGSGLGRDSAIASSGESSKGAWPAYEERAQEAYRAYYEYMPKGDTKIEYTVRLNNSGRFALPPTRIEALYAPELYGESPNAALTVR